MKKLICILVVLLLLAGCGVREATDEKLSVVTTIFPVYDWVNQILGEQAENVEVTLLLDNGVDLHSYQPTADDIVTIASCDLFIYVGGHSDEWVEDVLAQTKNEERVVIDLFAVLGDAVKTEEVVDGMEHEHEEDDHAHEEQEEKDEHIWLSLRNAKVACQAIGGKLGAIDPENAQTYTTNTESYCQNLTALDAEYRSAVDSAPVKTLLFGDRFPFRYLVDDYGLSYYAAFSGCSAESEASFETIAFLAGKLDELGLRSVITLKGSDGSIAKTIISTSAANHADILTLDSMQTTTAKDTEDGASYLTVMERNLETLKTALN